MIDRTCQTRHIQVNRNDIRHRPAGWLSPAWVAFTGTFPLQCRSQVHLIAPQIKLDYVMGLDGGLYQRYDTIFQTKQSRPYIPTAFSTCLYRKRQVGRVVGHLNKLFHVLYATSEISILSATTAVFSWYPTAASPAMSPYGREKIKFSQNHPALSSTGCVDEFATG